MQYLTSMSYIGVSPFITLYMLSTHKHAPVEPPSEHKLIGIHLEQVGTSVENCTSAKPLAAVWLCQVLDCL